MDANRLRELLKKEVSKMMRKLTVISLLVGLCLMGVTPVLAQKSYSTLAEYEELTGKRIEAFDEAPMLKVKVATGELPAVEKRLPEEPMIVEPLEEIGQYGGIIKAAGLGRALGGIMTIHYQPLLRISPDLKNITPNIVKNFELSKDCKVLTIYLRKGMKWSDGAPFTADDFLFWYEDIVLNDELTPVKPKKWSPGEKLMEVNKLDDYTVRFEFAVPYPPVISLLAVSGQIAGGLFAPKHYLEQYHIKYNSKANEIAEKEGFDHWWQCFIFHNPLDGTWNRQQDPSLPTLNAWTLKERTTTQVVFERNPYYWKIDTAGNQLPYVDGGIQIVTENEEVLALKAIAGEFDVVGVRAKLIDYPLYKMNEAKGEYHMMLWESVKGAMHEFAFNLNHKDPVLRKIFNDIRFKQAMSLAINRSEINEVFYSGRAVPRQATAHPSVSFYEDWMGEYYVEYDPERAIKLLDEMGLDKRGEDGYRLRPDGYTLAVTIEFKPMRGERVKLCELVKDYWEKVGVKVAIKTQAAKLYMQRGKANERDVSCWDFAAVTEFAMFADPRRIYPCAGEHNGGAAIEWDNWYKSDGKAGEEPPEEIKEYYRLIENWQTNAIGTEEYERLGKEVLTTHVKNLFVIGTVGLSPWPVLIKNNLHNTPTHGTWGFDARLWLPYQGDQWFFKK